MHVVRALAAFVAVRESERVCEYAFRLCCTLLHRSPHRRTRAFPCWKNTKRHITRSPDRTHVRSTLSIRYNKGKRACADEEFRAAQPFLFSLACDIVAFTFTCTRHSRFHFHSHAAQPLATWESARLSMSSARRSRFHFHLHAAQPLALSLACGTAACDAVAFLDGELHAAPPLAPSLPLSLAQVVTELDL